MTETCDVPDAERRTTIVQLAREMAESGLYRGWRSIEGRLRADGLPRVREALDDPDLRRELDVHCRASCSGHPFAPR